MFSNFFITFQRVNFQEIKLLLHGKKMASKLNSTHVIANAKSQFLGILIHFSATAVSYTGLDPSDSSIPLGG